LGELRCIQAEVSDGLLIELSGCLQLLALLELLHGVRRLAAPASVGWACLEAILVQRPLNLPHLTARQAVGGYGLVILGSLLLLAAS
jgi:hypothetical protein